MFFFSKSNKLKIKEMYLIFYKQNYHKKDNEMRNLEKDIKYYLSFLLTQ